MNNHANLAPGSVVPASGKYRCSFCGDGGIADLTAQLLGDMGTPQLRSKAKQQTVRYFQMGKRFPECPNCGSGTGWTLLDQVTPGAIGQLAHDQVVEESGVCDVCNTRVVNPNGYLLTTRQVVSTPGYWSHYYETHRSELLSLGVKDLAAFRRNPIVMTGCAKAMADQSSNWMVCDRCISLFRVDQNIARDYARRWWESSKTFNPPGTGAVPLSVVDMGLGPIDASTAVKPDTDAGQKGNRSSGDDQLNHEQTIKALNAEAEIYDAYTIMLTGAKDERKQLSSFRWFFQRRRIVKDARRRFHAAVAELSNTAGPAKAREVLGKLKD
jgi:hypothetical protein